MAAASAKIGNQVCMHGGKFVLHIMEMLYMYIGCAMQYNKHTKLE